MSGSKNAPSPHSFQALINKKGSGNPGKLFILLLKKTSNLSGFDPINFVAFLKPLHLGLLSHPTHTPGNWTS